MRRTEFDRLVEGEFGVSFAGWIAGTHVLERYGKTALACIEDGVDLRDVWLSLCDDFEVPESRRLGEDLV